MSTYLDDRVRSERLNVHHDLGSLHCRAERHAAGSCQLDSGWDGSAVHAGLGKGKRLEADLHAKVVVCGEELQVDQRLVHHLRWQVGALKVGAALHSLCVCRVRNLVHLVVQNGRREERAGVDSAGAEREVEKHELHGRLVVDLEAPVAAGEDLRGKGDRSFRDKPIIHLFIYLFIHPPPQSCLPRS